LRNFKILTELTRSSLILKRGKCMINMERKASEKEGEVALISAISSEECSEAVADRSKVDPKREKAFFKLSKSL